MLAPILAVTPGQVNLQAPFVVTPSNSAKKGEVIIIYMTGLGPVSPAAPVSPSTPSGEPDLNIQWLRRIWNSPERVP